MMFHSGSSRANQVWVKLKLGYGKTVDPEYRQATFHYKLEC